MRHRLWLLMPAAVLCVADVGLTLTGQPPAFWGGDYGSAVEANPVAYPLLTRSPWLFVVLAAVWLVAFSVVVICWRHPATGWLAMFVAAAHAVGGASWLTRIGPWGLVAAVLFLVFAAQVSWWCRGRFSQAVAANASGRRVTAQPARSPT